ncbi:MAG: MBL fold metallo-hydrolase [Deltaproteobacteria bacterium]|uniref:MBL fold metallo-hydrolase n=1 Tax=Candidatus Zymogenus saltonus TaxID=2844893 RepID=A0A9D8KC63_9DELT|nr:MBL fold metallo-hydrolase [Candidatus Zymogenus saltonus]
MEIADGIYTYRDRPGEKIRPGAGSASVTIVSGDALLMIDSGVVSGGALEELEAAIERDGLKLSDVGQVTYTHSHWDHINSAGLLKSKSGAKIFASAAAKRYIENPKDNFDGFLPDFGPLTKEVFPYPILLARILTRYAWGKQPRIKVDGVVSGGDCICADTIGREVRAVSLPGHTDGHTGYFIPDAGLLVAGDLIDFENSQGMDLNNPRSSYASAVESLKSALSLEPEILIPGHGEPTVGRKKAREVLERALSGGLKYPEIIKNALAGGPLRLKEIMAAIFPDVPFSMEAMTLMLILTVLLDMEKGGMVNRLIKSGRSAWERAD